MNAIKKLNLGSADKRIPGFLNVDKFDAFAPDIIHDLEVLPYPFLDSEIDEIKLIHVLEHIEQIPDVFIKIMKELYRVCYNQANIYISVPHPRHDDFFADSTHVRPITTLSLSLFDLDLNKQWKKNGAANTPLAIIHNVNFKIIKNEEILDTKYLNLLSEKKFLKKK